MSRVLPAAVALALLATAVYAQETQQPLTKDEVLKLVKAGVSDDVIVARLEQAKASIQLTADEIAALKKEGVSDRVLVAMLGATAEPNLVVENSSHRAIKVTVDEQAGVVSFGMASGKDLDRGGRMDLKVKPGEYRIAVEGTPSRHTVKLPGRLWVRGAEMEYLDVVTLTIEDSSGSTIMILHSVGKQLESQRRYPSVRDEEIESLYGPQFTYLPFISNNVLLGAGIGAIIGHHYGHRTKGALIGAGAGLLLDVWTWRFR